jgi:hypothetical protein
MGLVSLLGGALGGPQSSAAAGFCNPVNLNEFCWPADPGAVLYEAARSSFPWFADCIVIKTTETSWIDPTLLAPGRSLYYLERTFDPGPDSWGTDSLGNERMLSCSCAAWARTIGGSGEDLLLSGAATTDGGVLLVGATRSFTIGDRDGWGVRLDADGNILWARTYGDENAEQGQFAQQTSDGGFIVFGSAQNDVTMEWDMVLLRLDSAGNLLWLRSLGDPTLEDRGREVRQRADGAFIQVGRTRSFSALGDFDIWVLKWDATGNLQQQRVFGGADSDRARAVELTSDGGSIVAGRTRSNPAGAGDADIWLMKLDANLIPQWQKTYGDAGLETAQSVRQTPDGGYIVAGWTQSFSAWGGQDVWLLKLDAVGNIDWQKRYGGPGADEARQIHAAADGYVVAGLIAPTAGGDPDAWLFMVDPAGQLVWQRTFGGSGPDGARGIVPNGAGGYFVVAQTPDSSGDIDFWSLKTDQTGGISGTCSFIGNSSAVVASTTAAPGDFPVPGFVPTIQPISASIEVLSTNPTNVLQCVEGCP